MGTEPSEKPDDSTAQQQGHQGDQGKTDTADSKGPKVTLARTLSMQKDDPEYVHPCAYIFLYLFSFFAYWFGAKRFDCDGDGDFDLDDAKKMVNRINENITGKKTNNVEQQSKWNSSVELPPIVEQPKTSPNTSNAQPEAEREGSGFLDQIEDAQDALEDLGMTRKIDGDEAVEDKFLHQTFPYFIVGQTVAAILLWILGLIILAAKGDNSENPFFRKSGIDTWSDGWSELRLTDGNCADYRPQVWRWLTYQWTHVGIGHIGLNSFMNLVFGIPLEGLHGHLRMAFMYNLGVVGGAFCYWAWDAHSVVVGMSGGCYSLIGMHVSNLVMNWSQMKFRIPTLIFIIVLVTLEMALYFSMDKDGTSHAAHLGGVICGLLVSTVIGKNLVVHRLERVLQIISVTIVVILALICFIWMIANEAPRNWSEDHGWCYVGQIYEYLRFGNTWQCVLCDSKQCMKNLVDTLSQQSVQPISAKQCVNWWTPPQTNSIYR